MKRSLMACGAVISLLLTQCTKEPLENLTADESRIYVTNYDTAARFGTYKTFKIADSVANIENNRLYSKTRTTFDAQAVSAVSNALVQRGYVPVAAGATPDLGITISTLTNTTTQLVNYTDYGGAYGGYWDPYYWGYSNYSYYFPTYYGIYETDETTLSIDAIDIKNATQNNNQLDVVWSGLIRGSGIFSGNTINSQIDALFAQSAYFKTN